MHKVFLYGMMISIHASEKEATGWMETKKGKENISIHASEKEATMRWFKSNIPSKISIHASEKEATALVQIQHTQ